LSNVCHRGGEALHGDDIDDARCDKALGGDTPSGDLPS